MRHGLSTSDRRKPIQGYSLVVSCNLIGWASSAWQKAESLLLEFFRIHLLQLAIHICCKWHAWLYTFPLQTEHSHFVNYEQKVIQNILVYSFYSSISTPRLFARCTVHPQVPGHKHWDPLGALRPRVASLRRTCWQMHVFEHTGSNAWRWLG